MGEVKEDKYRDHIYGEGEANTVWRHGAPPNYDVVNKLFEEERTYVSFYFLQTLPKISYNDEGYISHSEN
jgi:hypothetical protein